LAWPADPYDLDPTAGRTNRGLIATFLLGRLCYTTRYSVRNNDASLSLRLHQ